MSRTTLLAVTGLFFLGLAGPASAQRSPSGLGVVGGSIQPSERLGGGSLSGVGVTGILGLTARTSLEASWLFYGSATTERYSQPLDQVRYSLDHASLSIRAPLIGETTELSLLLTGGALRFRTTADDASSPRTKHVIPTVGGGLGLRVPLVAGFRADASYHHNIVWARQGELGSVQGERGIGHSPEFRIGLNWAFKRKSPRMKGWDNLPLAHLNDFRPVDAATVRNEPNATTAGRSHMHTDHGTAIGVKPVDLAEWHGLAAPTGVSLLAPTGDAHPLTPLNLGTIHFESGSYLVAPDYRDLLEDAASFLARNPEAKVVLMGYTDSKGGARNNLSLGEQRGTAIQELLTRLYDVAPGRISVTSYGVDFTTGSDSRARRVDIVTWLPVGYSPR